MTTVDCSGIDLGSNEDDMRVWTADVSWVIDDDQLVDAEDLAAHVAAIGQMMLGVPVRAHRGAAGEPIGVPLRHCHRAHALEGPIAHLRTAQCNGHRKPAILGQPICCRCEYRGRGICKHA